MSRQNLKVALHVPIAAPVVGDAIKVTAVSATNPPTTVYAPAGAVLPVATADGQFLVTDVAPGFLPKWDDANGGRY